MKKLFLLLLIVHCSLFIVNAQSPKAFKYQAVARDTEGKTLVNKAVIIRIGISKSSSGTPVVYTETFKDTTNQFGLINIEIGSGTIVSGSFKDINWAEGTYYISTELSTDDGNIFSQMGITQLLSVPYALYADKSGSDKIVKLTGENNVTVAGTYPDFAIKGSPSLTQEEIDALTPYDGMIVHNKTTNCINYYYIDSWYETCGICTPKPTKADAGPDSLIKTGTSTVLKANTPIKGKGQWSIISGNGGNIENPSDPASIFTGLVDVKYTLLWTITTNCGISSDTVNIRFWACGLPITDLRDNKIYKTVLIGSQCWLSQNLNIGSMINSSSSQSDNGIIEKYCYDNDSNNCDVYGGLYQWNEAMNYTEIEKAKGICMEGWHLPSDAELFALENFVDPSINDPNTIYYRGTDGGTKLKQDGSSGFEWLLGGGRHSDGTFGDIEVNGALWSSTAYVSSNAWYRFVYTTYSSISRYNSGKTDGFSLRCLKD